MKIKVELRHGGVVIYETKETLTHGKTLKRCLEQGFKQISVKT